MKVLKPRGWEGIEAKCERCRSKVLIEADDVAFTHEHGDRFYARCGYCHEPIFILFEADIPLPIADLAYVKVMRERYDRPKRLEQQRHAR